MIADYDQNWDCFKNWGTAPVAIWGVDEVCTGNYTGNIHTVDNTSEATIPFGDQYNCYHLDGGYHFIAYVIIDQ
ncbi:hypothetical protein KSF_110650 [Reticulibacter mediterranei]|uniref:Uncharacterized protein n=1 Tax=Reticulibacter mediterranei TaxID=2778369 RepID=A0A8J3N731_9CHLR|nr:hypothetical protein KSF_110650 [Reticulibacter mediterranei]